MGSVFVLICCQYADEGFVQFVGALREDLNVAHESTVCGPSCMFVTAVKRQDLNA